MGRDPLVEREFKADAPNKLWVADITYIPTWAGFLFLAVVIDVWSRTVVGWSMAPHLRTELVLTAYDMAVARRQPKGVVHQIAGRRQFAPPRRCGTPDLDVEGTASRSSITPSRSPRTTGARGGISASPGWARRPDLAIPALRESLRLLPQDARIWLNLAIAQMTTGRFDDADACFRKALEMSPRDRYVWFNVGIAQAMRGDVAGLALTRGTPRELDDDLSAELERRLARMGVTR